MNKKTIIGVLCAAVLSVCSWQAYQHKSAIKLQLIRTFCPPKKYTPLKTADFPRQAFTQHIDTAHEKPLVVVIPSYNNVEWYARNLDSVFSQKYTNYRVIYIDDASPDNTGKYVHNYVHKHGLEHKITFIRNEQRKGSPLANTYTGAHMCHNHEIVLTLDGDDWLTDDQVFNEINSAYQDPSVWMTYGQYQEYPSGKIGICESIPQNVIANNNIRNYKWVTSHMRTFYAWLFKKIDKKDLLFNDDFFVASCDIAQMIPMLEMAGEHVAFIEKPIYQYNMINPINNFRIKLKKQEALEQVIRKRTQYTPLSHSPLDTHEHTHQQHHYLHA